ncbi:MAG: class I SAM-dependent methyltransferase family protein, partial [Promethearchaeota archaeon]
RFDFTKIMFAKGNVHERALLPTHIKPGEVIVDMFSGIGYFTLGIAKTRKPSKMYSIEWNPTSYKYLCENLKLNKVDDLVTPIFGDCRDKVRELYDQGLKADRVIMGLLPAPVNCISAALLLVKPEGTIIVYEGIERRESTKLFDEFTEIATKDGFKCEIIDRRIVKAFKPHEYHVVIEILAKSL